MLRFYTGLNNRVYVAIDYGDIRATMTIRNPNLLIQTLHYPTQQHEQHKIRDSICAGATSKRKPGNRDAHTSCFLPPQEVLAKSRATCKPYTIQTVSRRVCGSGSHDVSVSLGLHRSRHLYQLST